MSASPSINSFGQVWGGSLISTFLGCAIYGITIAQTFYYFNHYSSDRVTWKALVAIVFILDSASLVCIMYSMYYYLVLSWGIPEMTAPDVKSFPAEYVTSAVIVFMVQVFYINTIRALQAPPAITIMLLALSLVAFGTGLILPILQLKLKLIYTIVIAPLNHTAFNIARGTALACDLGIVVALCWLLGLRRTDVKRANNTINWLILIAVQRGVLQAIIQMGEVLAYAIKPSGVFFIPFHVIVSRIYCVSLLSSLNSREYIASKLIPTYICRRQSGQEAGLPTRTVQFERRATGNSAVPSIRPVLSSFIEPPFLESAARTRSFNASGISEPRQSVSRFREELDDEPAFPPGVPLPRLDSHGARSLGPYSSDDSFAFSKEEKSQSASDLEKSEHSS